MNANDSFDVVWPQLLNRAADIGGDALALLDRMLPENTSMGTMPEGAVCRLHLAATATYRSAIVCLRWPETSVAAFSLLRGLLEAWSHLAFIGDDAEGGDARCRALRYELGAAREWANSVHDAPRGFDRQSWSTQAQTRRGDLEAMWGELGCAGSYRTRSHVEPTLKKLAKKPRMEWVLGVWRATSATVHMYAVDFMLRDCGDGSSELVWALPRYRATWLSFVAAVYGYATLAAATILRAQDPAIKQFDEGVRRLVEGQDLRRAVDGQYDPGR